eukprot:6427392-Pyramimonas_sp.AAC.1
MPKSDAPCHQFAQGRCNRGDSCRFSHDPAAAEAAAAARAAMPKSDEACHQFAQGRCNRGDSCRFSHATPEMVTETIDDY